MQSPRYTTGRPTLTAKLRNYKLFPRNEKFFFGRSGPSHVEKRLPDGEVIFGEPEKTVQKVNGEDFSVGEPRPAKDLRFSIADGRQHSQGPLPRFPSAAENDFSQRSHFRSRVTR